MVLACLSVPIKSLHVTVATNNCSGERIYPVIYICAVKDISKINCQVFIIALFLLLSVMVKGIMKSSEVQLVTVTLSRSSELIYIYKLLQI